MSGAVQRMRATLRAAGASVSACAAVQQSYALALVARSEPAWRGFYFDLYAALFPLELVPSANAREERARAVLRNLVHDDFGSQLFASKAHTH